MTKAESIARLEKLAAECSQENSDGYGAVAVSTAAVANAARLIRVLPAQLPLPDPGAEPDGCVTLEWYASSSWLVSVSVPTEDRLDYLAWLGKRKEHGSWNFTYEAPASLVALLTDFVSGAEAAELGGRGQPCPRETKDGVMGG